MACTGVLGPLRSLDAVNRGDLFCYLCIHVSNESLIEAVCICLNCRV